MATVNNCYYIVTEAADVPPTYTSSISEIVEVLDNALSSAVTVVTFCSCVTDNLPSSSSLQHHMISTQ